MDANPIEKELYLLFPVSGKSLLGRSALLVARVYKAPSNLTGHQLTALKYADGVASQAHQDQGNCELSLEE
jgi:hypothetical protein